MCLNDLEKFIFKVSSNIIEDRVMFLPYYPKQVVYIGMLRIRLPKDTGH